MLLLPPQFRSTALHVAAEHGHKDVAELLLQRNADVNGVTWGKVVVFYFRVLVNVCVCVSSVRVLGGGGTVVAFCFCVFGNVYSYLMLRLCVDAKI